MITNSNDLQRIMPLLMAESMIALDTEFYWRNTYYPELCLIQIATTDHIYLIDALSAEINLQLLNPLFTSKHTLKIMHAAENDIKILRHYLDCEFNSIFDTQIAMAFLGHDHQLSLSNTLNHLGFDDLNKDEKMSDWRKRPLSSAQIAYATSDVISLIQCQKLLTDKLKQTSWLKAFEEEMQFIQKMHFNNTQDAPLKFKHHLARLSVSGRTHLIQLSIWREAYAQSRNWVTRYVLSDQELVNLAKLNPIDLQTIAEKHILSHKKVQRFGAELIQLLHVANTQYDMSLIERTRIKINKELLRLCFEYLAEIAEKQQLPIALVSSKQELKHFLYQKLINPQHMGSNKLNSGWRLQFFGQLITDYAYQQCSILGLPYNKILTN
ncbi:MULTISPECIES: ribonuclease D [Cysteiniphilum]|uniref:Ribonuclease D n=1 Tax=Cysteiniphilum litorale TaxID=2056700 RepID=A0A8J2Z3U5_9GAMM|nr:MULTISPECIES: HRDC domain-containing protein [Cysteiniphilum]GGF95009.1 ribonuclease D [Cysteiniphilum litorale]